METRQKQFDRWLDGILSRLDADFQAYCFNVYECLPRDCYTVELTGFRGNDDDWANDVENYASRNDNDEFGISGVDDLEQCLIEVGGLIAAYLKQGRYADKLKKAQKICYGFIDGDLYTVE